MSTPLITQVTSGIPINAWEWEYNGFLFGAGTNFNVISAQGVFDAPDIRDDSIDWMGEHGSFVNAQFYSSRVITITGDIADNVDDGEFANDIVLLRAALLARKDPIPLRINLPGWGTRVYYVVPLKFSLPGDQMFSIGYGVWAMQFKAGDPRIYDDNLQILSTGPPTENGLDYGGPGSGLDYGGPGSGLDYGGGQPGTLSVVNNGDINAPMVVTFVGPGIDPQIVNQTTNEVMRFNINLNPGDSLVVDTLARTVFLNGYSSVYYTFDHSSSWWDIQVGTNNLKFIIDSPSGSTLCSVAFRDTWV